MAARSPCFRKARRESSGWLSAIWKTPAGESMSLCMRSLDWIFLPPIFVSIIEPNMGGRKIQSSDRIHNDMLSPAGVFQIALNHPLDSRLAFRKQGDLAAIYDRRMDQRGNLRGR